MLKQLLVLILSLGLADSLRLSSWRSIIGSIGVAAGLQTISPDAIQPALADSTGKFSTKLTARKRYIPRITTGVSEFNGISSFASLQVFQKDGFPDLKRAMGLFGLSLRKGEVPDEISRLAEEKTEAFAKKVLKVSADNLNKELAEARAALDDYLDFAKLPLSSAVDYAVKK